MKGKTVDGIADHAILNSQGKRMAVEAKFVEDWASSLRNPASEIGSKPWAIAEQQKMLMQAQKYSAYFDEIIYHTNSVEFAHYYHQVFKKAGLHNIQIQITPTEFLR